jgi:hypothetical protein
MQADVVLKGDVTVRKAKALDAIASGETKPLQKELEMLVTARRVFAVTLFSYFCLAPQEAKPGDMIMVVTGGEVPLLLQPLEDQVRWPFLRDQNKFRLVGECYVHSIMDGREMKIAMEKGDLREIRIV